MNAPEWRGALTAPALHSAGSGIRLRMALPEDLPAIEAFVQALSPTTRMRRFFTPRRDFPAFLARALVEGDARHCFIVAEAAHSSPAPVVGLGQYARLASRQACELALVVGDEWQGLGLGARLLRRLIDDAGAAGLQEMEADVLPENRAMLALARRFGFVVDLHPDDPRLLRILRSLEPVRASAAAPTHELAPPIRAALRRAAAAWPSRLCAAR